MSIRGLLNRIGTGINNVGSGLADLQGDPVFNLGVGLLAAGGQRPGQRVSFGQGLLEAGNYMNQKQADFQKLEANRQALAQAKQQRAAQQGLVGLLNMPAAASVPAAIRRPNVQQSMNNQMMGLLAQADPQGFSQAMTESLLAPSAKLPSSVLETIAATGLNPGDPGFQEAFMGIKNPNAALDQLAAGINLRLAEESLLEAEDERERRARLERQSNTSLKNTVREIKGLVRNIRDTQGTNVEVGSLAASFIDGDADGSKIAEAIVTRFGNTPEEARQLASKYQEMYKGFGRLLGQQIPEGATNLAQARIVASNPGVNLLPGANAKFLSEALDDAIAQDIDQDGKLNVLDQAQIDEIRAIIREIEEYEASGGRPNPEPGDPNNNPPPRPGGFDRKVSNG